tara:strand:- start:7760 stop:8002 length:243 start_codon:yes stop_codon:yes gene_type:complete
MVLVSVVGVVVLVMVLVSVVGVVVYFLDLYRSSIVFLMLQKFFERHTGFLISTNFPLMYRTIVFVLVVLVMVLVSRESVN